MKCLMMLSWCFKPTKIQSPWKRRGVDIVERKFDNHWSHFLSHKLMFYIEYKTHEVHTSLVLCTTATVSLKTVSSFHRLSLDALQDTFLWSVHPIVKIYKSKRNIAKALLYLNSKRWCVCLNCYQHYKSLRDVAICTLLIFINKWLICVMQVYEGIF